jgi:hypothetical protein
VPAGQQGRCRVTAQEAGPARQHDTHRRTLVGAPTTSRAGSAAVWRRTGQYGPDDARPRCKEGAVTGLAEMRTAATRDRLVAQRARCSTVDVLAT